MARMALLQMSQSFKVDLARYGMIWPKDASQMATPGHMDHVELMAWHYIAQNGTMALAL